jgi:acyl-CoA thioester hydrolase
MGETDMQQAELREDYGYFTEITTRWMDNDIYGHVNNVVYYSYFDSVANQYLIAEGGLDIHSDRIIGFVVASNCQYKVISAGLRVNKLGNSSVEYGIAIFQQSAQIASATGTFTHVFVDRDTNKSVPIPATIRTALEMLLVA